jgi:hypothetical protein
MLADPKVLALRRTVVDVRHSRPLFNGDDLAALIATEVMPVLGQRRWTTAIVVEQPLQFGVSRQYQALAEHYSRDAIFSKVDEAIAWVLRQPMG